MAGLSREGSRHGAADLTGFALQGQDALGWKLPFGLSEALDRTVQGEAKDLPSCFWFKDYEQLQRCFAPLSMTDSNFFTCSKGWRTETRDRSPLL
jgi:hypothetical protein